MQPAALNETKTKVDQVSQRCGRDLAETNTKIVDHPGQLRDLGARIDAMAGRLASQQQNIEALTSRLQNVEALATRVRDLDALALRLRSAEDTAARGLARSVVLAGELQTLRHEQRLRRGALGAVRQICNINSYIALDGGPKPGVALPPVARAYFGLRRTGLGTLLRRIRPPVAVERTIAPIATPVASEDAAARTVTMLVPDDRIDRRVLAQARSLVRHGWRATVIAPPYPEPVDADQLAYPEIRIIRIDTSAPAPPETGTLRTRLPATGKWKEAYFFHDHFVAAALNAPAAVITAHDLPVLPAAIAAADHLGARIAYDAHEIYPEQHHFGRDRIALYKEVESEVIRFAHVVTTINESIAAEMARRYRIAPPRVVLNAPEIDPSRLPLPRGDLIREKLRLPDRRRILLFQGSLSINRNLENLTRAMAQVQDADVVLVFLGPGLQKRTELSEIAAGLELLDSRVFFLDAVDQTILLDYTASAEVGVVPYPAIDLNSRLCTPNKLFEFIVAGVPVLANDLPELRRFVHDNGFGQVHPMETPAEIARAIDTMFATDLTTYRENLRARGGEFTWDRQARTVIDVYTALETGAVPATDSG